MFSQVHLAPEEGSGATWAVLEHLHVGGQEGADQLHVVRVQHHCPGAQSQGCLHYCVIVTNGKVPQNHSKDVQSSSESKTDWFLVVHLKQVPITYFFALERVPKIMCYFIHKKGIRGFGAGSSKVDKREWLLLNLSIQPTLMLTLTYWVCIRRWWRWGGGSVIQTCRKSGI